jgi:ABC-type lipoprotein export system ATPase subunit
MGRVCYFARDFDKHVWLMIEVSGLSFSYKQSSVLAFPDFRVERGTSMLLLGESGSGKTTLLHLLGGLLRDYNGSVKIDGTELSGLSETALDKFRGQRIGYIFQKNHLISALTVEQNLKLAPYLAGIDLSAQRISEVLEKLGLLEKRYDRIHELSHGQAQRVSIARAVLNKPAIIFADEPTSALDDRNCNRVIEILMKAASDSNSALVIATHDQRLKDKIERRIELSTITNSGQAI